MMIRILAIGFFLSLCWLLLILFGPQFVEGAYRCWHCDGQAHGDGNCDGVVNLADLALLKQEIFFSDGVCSDYNHDGRVNLDDLTILKRGFGTGGYMTEPNIPPMRPFSSDCNKCNDCGQTGSFTQ